jgi:hypothetical protein
MIVNLLLMIFKILAIAYWKFLKKYRQLKEKRKKPIETLTVYYELAHLIEFQAL